MQSHAQFLKGLIGFFVFAAACAAGSPDLLEVPDQRWASACADKKVDLQRQRLSNLVARGTLDVAQVGPIEVTAFEFGLGVPFRIESIQLDSSFSLDTGNTVVRGPDQQALIVDAGDATKFTRLLTSSSYSDVVVEAMGDSLTTTRLLYEALQLSLDDISCLERDRSDNVWQLAILGEKSILATRSPRLLDAYLVSDGQWTGFATCFEHGPHFFLDIEVENGARKLVSILKAIGACSELNDYVSELVVQ